MKNHLEDTT